MTEPLCAIARVIIAAAGFALTIAGPAAQVRPTANGKTPVHAKQVKRLLIKSAMIIPGTGVPASGPSDILLEDGLIARIGNSEAGRWPEADSTIDGAGKYIMPGIVNTHMHWHEERVGPIPI